MKAILKRVIQEDKYILGVLEVRDGDKLEAVFTTIERPWLENERRVSAIPLGTYQLEKRTSEKFPYVHYWVKNVPNRDFILIHRANYVRELQGCIGVGLGFSDIDNDDLIDITSSKAALDSLITYNLESLEIR